MAIAYIVSQKILRETFNIYMSPSLVSNKSHITIIHIGRFIQLEGSEHIRNITRLYIMYTYKDYICSIQM